MTAQNGHSEKVIIINYHKIKPITDIPSSLLLSLQNNFITLHIKYIVSYFEMHIAKVGTQIANLEISLTMAINYHIQELPDMHNGKQKFFPKAETYTAFNYKKMIKRIALESGLQEGAVLAVLDALPKALKNILLEGHTCKIDGLGTFSLSLSFNEDGRVGINRMNLKVDSNLIGEIRKEAQFNKVQSDVVSVASSKRNFTQHVEMLSEWLTLHESITLQEYANLIRTSTSTASRELKKICAMEECKITSSGIGARKIWIKS